MNNNRNIFIPGIILSYLVLIIIPSSKFAPIPFVIFFLSSLLYSRNFKDSLILSAIFSIPYSWGKSLLYIDDLSLLVMTPFAGFIIFSTIFLLKDKNNIPLSLSELFLLLFFVWGIISFIVTNTYPEVLDGIFKITIGILFYLNIKSKFKDLRFMRLVIFVLFSISIFESILAIIQFFLGHPIGLYIEESINLYPFGRVSIENSSIFRSTGTFIEPTYLARFLTILFPLIFIKLNSTFPVRNEFRISVVILSLLAIFVSFTRFSWFITVLIFVFLILWKKQNLDIYQFIKPKLILFIIFFLIFGFITLFPYLEQRIMTINQSFLEGGSFDYRIKLVYEAVNLIIQYPIFGVGINRFVSVALENNITRFFQDFMTTVHNVPLMIASEMGIPALIFFIGFILFSYKKYISKRNNINSSDSMEISDYAAFGGIVYLLESMMGTIFLSPHLMLFFLYMAIISS